MVTKTLETITTAVTMVTMTTTTMTMVTLTTVAMTMLTMTTSIIRFGGAVNAQAKEREKAPNHARSQKTRKGNGGDDGKDIDGEDDESNDDNEGDDDDSVLWDKTRSF